MTGRDEASSWELHIGGRTWRVGPNGLVIGRGSDCDVVIADPSISRRHAVVSLGPTGRLTIEDPGSRHGTRVNGVRINGMVPLRHGDRIAIAEHTFVVFETTRLGRERAQTATIAAVRPDPTQTVPNARPPRAAEATSEIDPAAMLLVAAEDALSRGDSTAFTRDLGRVRDIVERGEHTGGADAALLRRFAACALRAAGTLGRGDWIDVVVDLHTIRPRVMHAATIDALEGAFERVLAYDRGKFTRYVRLVQDMNARSLGTYERFCLERLATLV